MCNYVTGRNTQTWRDILYEHDVTVVPYTQSMMILWLKSKRNCEVKHIIIQYIQRKALDNKNNYREYEIIKIKNYYNAKCWKILKTTNTQAAILNVWCLLKLMFKMGKGKTSTELLSRNNCKILHNARKLIWFAELRELKPKSFYFVTPVDTYL